MPKRSKHGKNNYFVKANVQHWKANNAKMHQGTEKKLQK